MDEKLILLAESLVAVMGVKHVLREKPRPASDVERKRAAKLPTVIAERVADLVSMKKPAKQVGPPELPKYRETSDALAKGVDQDLLVETLSRIKPELQAACTMVWTRAVTYLNSRFPRRIEQRLTGPYLHEPSKGEWAEFGWAWRSANAPMFVIDLAMEGMLIGVEVTHLQAMFPAIYAEICADIDNSLADKVAEDKEWQPPWWLRKQICGILGISPVSASLVADIEAAVQQSQQAKAKTGKLDIKATSTGETQSQQLASGAKK